MNQPPAKMNTPRFRSDLDIIRRQEDGKSDRYFIRDRQSHQAIEVGEEEFFLLQQMDGTSALPAIKTRFEDRFHLELPLHKLETFIRQLQNGSFLSDGSAQTGRPDIPQWIPYRELPILIAAHLCRKMVEGLPPWLKTVFLPCAVGLIISASAILWANWGDLQTGMRGLWTLTPRHAIFGLLIAYFLLNIPHEFAHGIACAHFRGRIQEMGLRFFFNLVPVFYCKFFDVFWLKKKRERIWIWFAGGFYQLLVLGVGILGWRLTASESGAHEFFLAVSTVAFAAMLFNLIPLLNRDGYFMMIEAFEIRDLRKRAFETAKAWILRRPAPEPLSSGQRLGFWAFTLLAIPYTYIPFIAWHVATQLTQALQGTGALILIGAGLFLFQRPIGRSLMQLSPIRWLQGIRVGAARRRLIRYALLLAFLLLMLIPYPYDTGGPFRLVPYQQVEVRAQVNGEVTGVLVSEGQMVHAGEKLATLNRRIYEKDLKLTQEQLEHQKAVLRLVKEGPKPEQIDKARQSVKTAKVRLEYSTREAQRLETLYEQKVISEQAWDDAKKQRDLDADKLAQADAELTLIKSGARPDTIESVEAEVRRLEAQVAHIQDNLDLTTLTSPIDGRVTSPYLDERLGHYLKEGDVFAVIQDQHIIQAEVEVPETDIGDVRTGSKVRIRMWAYPTMTFPGEVASIAPIAIGKPEDRFIRVLTNIPNPDGLLKPDMTGYAKIESKTRPVGIVLTRIIVRFFLVQVWYWIP
jgi:putative peptide zinc metalloprotease protein